MQAPDAEFKVTEAPVYRPTQLEWSDPILFVEKIRAKAQLFGICKIIPPHGWKPPINIDSDALTFRTLRQRVDLLQCRDLDDAKVDFLTRLTTFWQRRRRIQWAAARQALLQPKPVVVTPPPPTLAPPSGRVHGERRTEMQLLEDVRRRPQPAAQPAAASSKGAAAAASAKAREPVSLEQQLALRSSALTRQIHAAAKQQAETSLQGRATRATRALTPKKPASASPTALSVAEVDRLLQERWPGDDNNFTLDGVTLSVGEIVPPVLRLNAGARGSGTAAESLEVDLFVLHALVQRYAADGMQRIGDAQWVDIMRTLCDIALIGERVNLFQGNEQAAHNVAAGHSTSSGKGSSPVKRGKPADSSSSAARNAAEALRTIYRTHLQAFVEEEQPANPKAGHDGQAEATSAGAAAAGRSDDAIAKAVSNGSMDMNDVAVRIPAPRFSAREIARWAQIRAQRQAKRAEAEAAAASSSPPAASSAAVRGSSKNSHSSCDVCHTNMLADTCQCAHCHRSFHCRCLIPPLRVVPPPLPWFCADCEVVEQFGFAEGRQYLLRDYVSMAEKFKHDYFASTQPQLTDERCPAANSGGICTCRITQSDIVAAYWRIVEGGNHSTPVSVEYGSDIDTGTLVASTSGLPNSGEYARSSWNLNNLPSESRSLLSHLGLTHISGVSVPWMYVGMLFSSFCWLVEDHYMFSINFHLKGAVKQWYGIPAHAATGFEAVWRRELPHLFSKQPGLQSGLVTMLSPRKLMAAGVPVYTMQQEPGEFVLTFPQAYHCGFNHGVNVAEAVNFAPANWLPYSVRSVERYRAYHRAPLFSTDHLFIHLTSKLQDKSAIDQYLRVWLLPCLQRMHDEEIVLREHLRAGGLVKATPWTDALQRELFESQAAAAAAATAASGEEGEVPVRQMRGKAIRKFKESKEASASAPCFHCKHAAHVSAVWCACRPAEVACLRHAALLCSCPASSQTLLVRYPVAELHRIVRHLDMRIQSNRGQLFYEMGIERFPGRPDVVESVEDILRESEERLRDPEVPIFCTESEKAAPTRAAAAAAAAAAAMAQPASARQTPASNDDEEQSYSAEHAVELADAVHKNALLLRTTAEEVQQALANAAAVLHEAAATVRSTGSVPRPALVAIQAILHRAPAVTVSSQREVIVAPPLLEVRQPVEQRCIAWLRRLGPYLLSSQQLQREVRHTERMESRARGMDTDSSDDDDDTDDDVDELLDSLPLRFDAEQLGEDEEERVDRAISAMLKRAPFEVHTSPTQPNKKKAVRKVAAAAKLSAAAALKPVPSVPLIKLSLVELRDALEEGREFIWSTTFSREATLVFHKLTHWQQLTRQMEQLGSSGAIPRDASAPSRDGNAADSVGPSKKLELVVARRLARAVASAPIDFALSSHMVATPASNGIATNQAAHDLSAYCQALKAQVTACELLEQQVERALVSETSKLSTAERMAHPHLLEFEQLCLLQAKVNALPLSFPASTKLAKYVSAISALLHESSMLLRKTPLPPRFSEEEVLQFTVTNQPWSSEEGASSSAMHVDDAGDEKLEQPRLTPPSVLLGKMVKFPFKHACFAQIEELLASVNGLADRIKQTLAAVREQRTLQEEYDESKSAGMALDESRAFVGPVLGDLKALLVRARQLGLKAQEVDRLSQLVEQVKRWQAALREEAQRCGTSMLLLFRSILLNKPAAAATGSASSSGGARPSRETDGAEAKALASAVRSLQELEQSLSQLGVGGIPERAHLLLLRGFVDFLARFHKQLVLPLQNTGRSRFFNFSSLQPREWLVQLTAAFEPAHPLRTSWKDQSWKDVLARAIKLEQTSNASAAPGAGSSNVANKPVKRAHDADGAASRKKGKHDPPSTSSASSGPVGRDVAAGVAPMECDSDAGASAAKSTPVVAAAQAAMSSAAAAAPSSAPPRARPSVESKRATHASRDRNLSELLHLLDCGQELLSQVTELDDESTKVSSDYTSVIGLCLKQMDELGQLLARVQQHIDHLADLQRGIEAHKALSATATAQQQTEKEAALEASEKYLAQVSGPTSPAPQHPLLCAQFPSPTICPFYSIAEIEKLYVLWRVLDQHLRLKLANAPMLKQLYCQAYHWQLACQRVLQSPFLRLDVLLQSDDKAFMNASARRQQDLAQMQHYRDFRAFDTEQRLAQQTKAPSSSGSNSSGHGAGSWTAAYSATDMEPFWRNLRHSIAIEQSLEIDPSLWQHLLNGDSWHRRPQATKPGEVAPKLLLPSHALQSLRPHHHPSGVHVFNSHWYASLATQFQKLYRWCQRANEIVDRLREQRAECVRRPLDTPALGTSARGTAAPTPCRIDSELLEAANALVVEAAHMQLLCPLLRKMQQGVWSLRAYEALSTKKPFSEMAMLYGQVPFYRASQAQLSVAGSDDAMDDDTPAASPTLGEDDTPAASAAAAASNVPKPYTLSDLMAAHPASEFDRTPWFDSFEACILRAREWRQKTATRIAEMDALSKEHHQFYKELGHLQHQHAALPRELPARLMPKYSVEELEDLARSACQCQTTVHCYELRVLRDRLTENQRWRLAVQACRNKALPRGSDAASPGASSPVGAASTSASQLPASGAFKISVIRRSIMYGASILTPELRFLFDLEQMHQEWLTRLDALFLPRHPKLEMRSLLLTLLPSANGAPEPAKTVWGSGERPRPVPDRNGFFCLCKSAFDSSNFMVMCATCAEWFHGSCVNLSFETAKVMRRDYICPRCCEQAKEAYPFGSVQYSTARPELTQCRELMRWLDDRLAQLNAQGFVVCDHERKFRQLLQSVEDFRSKAQPFVPRSADGTLLTSLPPATTTSSPAAAAAGIIFRPLSSADMQQVKQWVRQGRRMGVRCPELLALKLAYDHGREMRPRHSATPPAATATAAATPTPPPTNSAAAAAAPPARSGSTASSVAEPPALIPLNANKEPREEPMTL